MPHKDYSGTPLWKKLGIREGSRMLLVGAPEDLSLGEDLPPGVRVLARVAKGVDVAVLFSTSSAEVERRFMALARSLDPAGRLWIAWPKKAANVRTDLTFDVAQGIGLDAGLVDNKSASITDVFQGLQFVYRLQDRPNR
jgi:hypothetical protein